MGSESCGGHYIADDNPSQLFQMAHYGIFILQVVFTIRSAIGPESFTIRDGLGLGISLCGPCIGRWLNGNIRGQLILNDDHIFGFSFRCLFMAGRNGTFCCFVYLYVYIYSIYYRYTSFTMVLYGCVFGHKNTGQ